MRADDDPADLPAARSGDPRFDPSAVRHRARRMAWLYLLAAAVLIPWTVYLAVTLPKRVVDTHYRGAWVGFDLLLVAAIALTAYYAFRADTRVQLPATATATLLLVDGWFDVMTAGHRQAVMLALVLALFVELPGALFSLWLARRVNINAARLALATQTTADPGRMQDDPA